MGWSSATEPLVLVARQLLKELPDPEARKRVYAPLVTWLSAADWDTQDEALGVDPALDELLEEYLER